MQATDTVETPEIRQILFGADRTRGIVAVEADRTHVTVYRRDGDVVLAEQDELRPWLMAERQVDLARAKWRPLTGAGYRFLAEFPEWADFQKGREKLASEGVNYFAYADPARHYLVRSGRTLLEGMDLLDLRRMQLDIETAGLSPNDTDARLILVAVADEGGPEVIEGEEPHILRRLRETIQERNPDVIEGHNIFGFDLPYLAARAERHGVPLDWGRDGSRLLFGRRRRCVIGGRTRPFVPAYVHGRHIIDTMLAVQRFDAQSGELESYGLKEVTKQLGLAESDRITVDQTRMEQEWLSNPERVRVYAQQDVLETRRLAEHVTQTDFYLTQMVPEPYQSVAVSGTGEKINALLVREYLRRGVALPQPRPLRRFAGGYVEVRRVGVISPIVKVDVESLYPSIMLTEQVAPASDTLAVFLPMLSELTRQRLQAKARARASTGTDRLRWEGIQSSFKVLINSFYGYLGSGFLFNDFEAAERVTKRGQALVKQIADEIERSGGGVVEIDTDGVYFSPPSSVRGEEAELAYVEEIGAGLPKGINLQHDGRYRAMLSLKQKNYACVGYDGRKLLRGAAVRSRADEPFGREFLAEAVDLLLEGELDGLARRYSDLSAAILAGEVPVEKLARRERVTEKTFSSPAKRRSAEIAGGTPIGDYISVYERRDGSLARTEDYSGDEDRAYYAEKLYRFALRLESAIGPEFDRAFPRPSTQAMRQASAGQMDLGLD